MHLFQRSRRTLTAVATATATVAALLGAGAAPAQADVSVHPRDFTGFGFDQCLTPSQAAMDAWLEHSPFWAVGVYISGNSRACRSQPNLTPAWVAAQSRAGWRILPITLGPQASCSTRFPRYDDDPTIRPDPRKNFYKARRQGRAEAATAVAAAKALGIGPRSTLWYDLEAFDISNTRCRESALWFLHAWTVRVRDLGYVSGMYSSAASGIRMVDDARVLRPGTFTLPDRIWLADWDGRANVSSPYFRSDGWLPGNRMKQYRGGHDEVHGGVRINIDSNWIDLGRGSVPLRDPVHCRGVDIDLPAYPFLRPGASGDDVRALQCVLKERRLYDGRVHGRYDAATTSAVRALRSRVGLPVRSTTNRHVWTALHALGRTPLTKVGGASEVVRRLQRSLVAANGEDLAITGSFDLATAAAVKRYQQDRGLPMTGVVTSQVWAQLRSGRT